MELSDISLVVSPFESNLIKERRPEFNVQILSNIHEITYSRTPFIERSGILFIGEFQTYTKC